MPRWMYLNAARAPPDTSSRTTTLIVIFHLRFTNALPPLIKYATIPRNVQKSYPNMRVQNAFPYYSAKNLDGWIVRFDNSASARICGGRCNKYGRLVGGRMREYARSGTSTQYC